MRYHYYPYIHPIISTIPHPIHTNNATYISMTIYDIYACIYYIYLLSRPLPAAGATGGGAEKEKAVTALCAVTALSNVLIELIRMHNKRMWNND